MERKVSRYTVRDLILGTREAYLHEMEELEKLQGLVTPLPGIATDIQFRLSGSILSSDLVCDVFRKYNKLERLLSSKKNGQKVYSYSLQSYGRIPYAHNDAEEFEKVKDGILSSDYFNNMGAAVNFTDEINSYLLQTSVEEVRLIRQANNITGHKEIVFKDGDSLYLGENTEIADALNMLNARLPKSEMPKYHIDLMDSVKDPFALRVVDARKADEIEKSNSVVILAKRM